MPQSRTADNRNSLDKLTDNFTSGQLVIGIVVTLFLMLGSFVVGYMARGIDSTTENGENSGERIAQAQPLDEEETAPEPERDRPPVQEPRPQRTTAPSTTTSPADDEQPQEDTGPRPVIVAPLDPEPAVAKEPEPESPPPEEAGPPADPEEAAPDPAPSPPVESESEAPLEFEEIAAPEEDVTAEGEPGNQPLPSTEPPQAAPAPAPSESPVRPSRGNFGIQIGAFFGGDSADRAAQRQQEMERDHALDVEVIPEPARNMHRVVITGYVTRAAADTACDSLRKQQEFSDAWVIPLGS